MVLPVVVSGIEWGRVGVEIFYRLLMGGVIGCL